MASRCMVTRSVPLISVASRSTALIVYTETAIDTFRGTLKG